MTARHLIAIGIAALLGCSQRIRGQPVVPRATGNTLRIDRQIGTGTERVSAVEWRSDAWSRQDNEAIGLVPKRTLLTNLHTGEELLVFHDFRVWGPGASPSGSAGRSMLAVDLGLSTTHDGVLAVPDPVFHRASPQPPAPTDAVAEPGEWFELAGGRVRWWVVSGLPLTGRDYAAALRKRIPSPWTQDEERLFSAIIALPGYPIVVETLDAAGALATRNAVVSLQREQRPADFFQPPADYKRADNVIDEVVRMTTQSWDQERQANRAKLGLDKPFVPTAAQPLPPSLPGGSCKPGKDECVESWDGRETSFFAYCELPFDFERSCPRTKLTGLCESPDRAMLRYHYGNRDLAKQNCAGRWYDVSK
jgi:hypothetical protein